MGEKPFNQLCDELHKAVEDIPPSIMFTDNFGNRWRSHNSGDTFRNLSEAQAVDTRPRWRRWVENMKERK